MKGFFLPFYSKPFIMLEIESAGLTDIGRKRKSNEDALYIDDHLGLYMVADGMGGHRAGEVASQMVLDTICDYIKRIEDHKKSEPHESFDSTLSHEANRLLSGIHLSNRVVHEIANSKDEYHGMGSTVSILYFNKQTLIAANVGDSPIYLIHKDKIELLSVPHTVLAEHALHNPDASNQLGKEFRHMLTRAMGVADTVKANICEIQCFRDDLLVIGSDGLSDLVTNSEIMEIVREAGQPQKACQNLVNLANERGGDDNITVVVLKIKNITSNHHGLTNLLSRVIARIINYISKS